jgi:hypothetical protein
MRFDAVWQFTNRQLHRGPAVVCSNRCQRSEFLSPSQNEHEVGRTQTLVGARQKVGNHILARRLVEFEPVWSAGRALASPQRRVTEAALQFVPALAHKPFIDLPTAPGEDWRG